MFVGKNWLAELIGLAALAGTWLLVPPALAQDDESESDEPAAEDTAPSAPMGEDAEFENEPDSATEEISDEEVLDAMDTGPTEKPGKQYLFVGARYRAVVIPTFVQNLFADGGETLVAHTPGAEFGIRKDGFEYNLFLQLGIYSASDVPFKGTSDPNTAWEIIDFDYNIIFAGSDFMWSTDEFTPGLSMTYGAGVGLGFVTGSLKRTQAYPDPVSAQGDPDAYRKCQGVGVPNALFCTNDNDHYDDFEEPTWADGGSSPIIFPWIAAQVGLRYKVTRNFVARVELGVMPTGGFFGIAADYGL